MCFQLLAYRQFCSSLAAAALHRRDIDVRCKVHPLGGGRGVAYAACHRKFCEKALGAITQLDFVSCSTFLPFYDLLFLPCLCISGQDNSRDYFTAFKLLIERHPS